MSNDNDDRKGSWRHIAGRPLNAATRRLGNAGKTAKSYPDVPGKPLFVAEELPAGGRMGETLLGRCRRIRWPGSLDVSRYRPRPWRLFATGSRRGKAQSHAQTGDQDLTGNKKTPDQGADRASYAPLRADAGRG